MNRSFRVFAFCACLFAAGAVLSQTPRPAGETKQDDSQPKGTQTCPLWVIYDYGFAKLYYCNYYTDPDCLTPPQASYLFGTFPFPCDCSTGGCLPGARKEGKEDCGCTPVPQPTAENFPGLKTIIAPTDDYIPPHVTLDYTQVMQPQKFQFVKFQGTDGRSRFAKLYALRCDLKNFPGLRTKDSEKTILVAVQCQSVPASETVESFEPGNPHHNECVALNNPDGSCHAYRLTCNEEVVPLTILALTKD